MNDSNKKDFKTILYKDLMPKIYGIGAAIVILGAMFKILNWPFSNIMIGMGLTTEAVIFFLSAFEPETKEYDWEMVYPELSKEYDGPVGVGKQSGGSVDTSSKAYNTQITALTKTLKSLNDVYSQEANQVSDRIGYNQELYNSASKAMEEMHRASAEAEEFKLELERLREKIAALNDIYENTLTALRG